MRFKMHDRSLFALLLRSPWWLSLLIAAAIALIARLALPADYVLYGMTASLPFVVIALVALVKQLQVPSASRVAATLGTVQTMSWRAFADAMEAAFVHDGYGVERLDLPAADFEITRGGRVTLVSCKRWKAASHGLGPLQELATLRTKREAAEAMYVSTGALTDNARRFAADNGIRSINGVELVQLLRDIALPAPAKP